MVRELGLSSELGPVGYPAGFGYLGGDYAGPHEFSDDTQRAIDLEVRRLVRQAEELAIKLLQDHRTQLDQLVELLLRDETVPGDRVYQLLAPEPPSQPLPTSVPPSRPPPPSCGSKLNGIGARPPGPGST
jgi:cell division protease FtsH